MREGIELMSAEDFFREETPANLGALRIAAHTKTDDPKLFEAKVKVMMKARGVSREEAEEMLEPYGNPGFIA